MALGWPNIAWGMKRISARELAEWEIEFSKDPWGEQRADLRTAIVAAVVESTATRKAVSPAKFMPYTKKQRPRRQTPDEMRRVCQTIAMGYALSYGDNQNPQRRN